MASPDNTAETKALWAAPREYATTRVTTFDASPEETLLAMFERIFDTIEKHEGDGGFELRMTSPVLIGVAAQCSARVLPRRLRLPRLR